VLFTESEYLQLCHVWDLSDLITGDVDNLKLWRKYELQGSEIWDMSACAWAITASSAQSVGTKCQFICSHLNGDCFNGQQILVMIAHKCYVPLFSKVDRKWRVQWYMWFLESGLSLFEFIPLHGAKLMSLLFVVPVLVSAALSRLSPRQ
jgi:hypothetical protein